jgi:hypothetical protein
MSGPSGWPEDQIHKKDKMAALISLIELATLLVETATGLVAV